MQSLIPSKRPELEEIRRRWQVRRFELFGSATRDDFTPASDLELFVEFESGGSLENYLGLRRAAIDRDRQLVYAA